MTINRNLDAERQSASTGNELVQSGSSGVTVNPVETYKLKISPLVVDKLGVKLYDRASAVVAELIANSYDADAEKVTVRIPLGTALATKKDSELLDTGYVIEVEDDGHGMEPSEAQGYYLQVGRNRRQYPGQGGRSRTKGRSVMGRKGIGKLAPFGICTRIEVISAGGPLTSSGYLVAHFYLDYGKILSMKDSDLVVQLDAGPLDRTYRPNGGTTVRLSNFQPKVVPPAETFYRQLAARFGFAAPDFEIWVEDARDPRSNPPKKMEHIDIPLMAETRIDLSSRPVVTDDGKRLRVEGWLGMGRSSYKNEELAGVRVYARDKLVATTRDFEQPAGYTGEFTARSYLVGEVFADWLDLDEEDDLIRSDRQSILWESDYGRALRKWGAELIKEIARASRRPRRTQMRDKFLEISNFVERARERYPQREVVEAAVDLARKIGAFASGDEIEDEDYVNELTEVVLAVAPHKALIQAFQDFAKKVDAGEVSMENLLDLFGKTRVAELASYGQIAAERVKSIRELEKIVYSTTSVREDEFQKLLAKSPWLIEPTWTVITENQSLRTFKAAFENYWFQRTTERLVLDIGYERKRPDFTLVHVGHMLHIVEIKTAGHYFDDNDYDRLIRYVDGFRSFFKQNPNFSKEFSLGWRIDLVADGVNLTDLRNQMGFDPLTKDGTIYQITWSDFLLHAKNAHEMFLKASDEFEKTYSLLDESPR